ncbi:MAG: MoaD/ThiS family protein [Chloroflexota bacterium]|jgi:D-mannonate dehydratase
MKNITINTWLYGDLARYGGDPLEKVFANPQVTLSNGACLRDLISALGMQTEERGITFINGELSAMPGMQPDLNHLLRDGDRVAFFHLRSMWPFQYRHGVTMINEMQQALQESDQMGIHHAYKVEKDPE